MSQPPPCPPSQVLSGLIRRIAFALEGLRAIGRVTSALLGLAMHKYIAALSSYRRLAARVEAGTYRPRRIGPRKPPAQRKPRDPDRPPLRRGWLAAVLPDANQYRGDLLYLLRDPETAKLVAAAPAEMRRIFRPLCWSLGLKPPPLLAIPKRPRPAPPPASPPPCAGQGRDAGQDSARGTRGTTPRKFSRPRPVSDRSAPPNATVAKTI